ncbi:MAG: hypothetical protein LWX70_11795 [Sphingobacteriia bacterium]|nr:hypothetical protein [Sphingobacteriia bacterium]
MIFLKKYRIRKAYAHLQKSERQRKGTIKPVTIEKAHFIQVTVSVETEESYNEILNLIGTLKSLGKEVQVAMFFSTKKIPSYVNINEISDDLFLFTKKQTESVFKNPHSLLKHFTESQSDILLNLCSPSLLISSQATVYSNSKFRVATTDSSNYYGDLLVICDPLTPISTRFQLIKDTLSIFKNH